MMTDILLIAGPEGQYDALVASAAAHHPRHVTVLVEAAEDPAWSSNESEAAARRRDRLATLLTATALATGAAVSGMVGDPARFSRAGYDAIVGGQNLLTTA